uniref:EGF-like domain-containing protein n=1 Tax=Romanomermis culicivorax TaxID=13658 RepID=A0A915JA01_ROMCU
MSEPNLHSFTFSLVCKCVLYSDYSMMCLDWKNTKVCESIPGMYICHDGSSCIYQTWILDGAFDCNDGSDENPMYWDECGLGLDNCDLNSMVCLDNVTQPVSPDGRFVCKCKPGYYSTDGGKSCKPITP